MILKDRFFILSLLTGLLLRVLFSPIQGFKFDVDTWFAWAQRLNDLGFSNFYSDKVWTGYPPGFLYILYILGLIKDLFKVNDFLFYISLKFPSIIGELAIGAFAYKLIPEKHKPWKKLALLFIVLNPAFIFNSAIFGQFDGLFTLFLILSVYYLSQKKLILSAALWSFSFLLKPQAILLCPVFLLFFLKNFSKNNIVNFLIPFVSVIFLGFLPFFPTNPIKGPVDIVFNLFGFYPYNSIFAYNIWGILGFWVLDNKSWLNITYQYWSYLLYILFWIIITIFYYRNKISLISLSTLAALSFFFLLTRMHERYLFPSLVFIIILACLKKSITLIILGTIYTLIHFLNLYYVYIYYNQIYLKLPPVLYNSSVYSWADSNIVLISIISTLIFFFTTFVILKSDDKIS